MSSIAIITDSNSGITQEEANRLNIGVIPMPFYIDEQLYFEGVSLNAQEFYEKLQEDHEIKTSQPSPADLLYLWDEKLKDYDYVMIWQADDTFREDYAALFENPADIDDRTIFAVNHETDLLERVYQ